MLLSVIIPAYNAEKYIAACLDSCLSQVSQPGAAEGDPNHLRDGEVEIIVVDDGSTDQTPQLLAQYAERHACIRLLHQPNQGQSVARNLALEAARGQYIYMVDSDDRMIAPAAGQPSVLPIAMMREERYDIIGLQVYYQPEHGPRRPWSHQMERWPYGQVYERGSDFVRCHNIEGLVYGYVFGRRLLAQHPELRFTPGIYHQDEELIFKLFTLAGATTYYRSYTYIYYEHTGSSLNTRTTQRRLKLMDDSVTIMQRLTAWRDRHGPDDPRTAELREVMQYKLAYLAMDMLRVLIRRQYEAAYIDHVLDELQALGYYPLPPLREGRYQAVRGLTHRRALVKWWAAHPALSRLTGF